MAKIWDNIVPFKSIDWLRPRSLRDGILDSIPATFQNLFHIWLAHGLGLCYSQLSFKISLHPLYSTWQPDIYLLTAPLVVCGAQQGVDSPQSQYLLLWLGFVCGPRDQPNGHWPIIIHNRPSGQHPSSNSWSVLRHGAGGLLVLLRQGPCSLYTVSPGLLQENQISQLHMAGSSQLYTASSLIFRLSLFVSFIKDLKAS